MELAKVSAIEVLAWLRVANGIFAPNLSKVLVSSRLLSVAALFNNEIK